MLCNQSIDALLWVIEEVIGQAFGEFHIVAVQIDAAAMALDAVSYTHLDVYKRQD